MVMHCEVLNISVDQRTAKFHVIKDGGLKNILPLS